MGMGMDTPVGFRNLGSKLASRDLTRHLELNLSKARTNSEGERVRVLTRGSVVSTRRRVLVLLHGYQGAPHLLDRSSRHWNLESRFVRVRVGAVCRVR
jgi:hypothetical protein